MKTGSKKSTDSWTAALGARSPGGGRQGRRRPSPRPPETLLRPAPPVAGRSQVSFKSQNSLTEDTDDTEDTEDDSLTNLLSFPFVSLLPWLLLPSPFSPRGAFAEAGRWTTAAPESQYAHAPADLQGDFFSTFLTMAQLAHRTTSHIRATLCTRRILGNSPAWR